jgi:curli biogenesis system outer membrane secretion channel CsgG
MKHALLGCGLFLLTMVPALAQQGGLRYTIQVTKFENKAGWSGQWSLGDGWGAVLTEKLQASGKFIVIAEADMRDAAMDEQDFAASGRTVSGSSKGPKVGQMTPAQLLVKGVITAFDDGSKGSGGVSYKGIGLRTKGGKAMISGTVYVVDATTGQVTASEPFEAEVKSRGLSVSVSKNGFYGDVGGFQKTPAGKVMAEACDQVVKFLHSQTEAVRWSGKIVKGGVDSIIINRGTREGVKAGMVFRLGEMEEIRDPDTGELLDNDFFETSKIEVTRVKEKIAYCKLVSGDTPERGQTFVQ